MLQGSHLSLRRPGDRLPQEPDGRTVFVGGLSWDLDSKGLKAFGEQVGEVSYAAVFTNRETGKSKGSGKVQFANSELALKAVENLNGRELLGREAEPCDRVGGAPLFWHASKAFPPMSIDQKATLAEPFLSDDLSDMYFYGAVKSFTDRGFGWLSCLDTAARFGRDVYLSKEDAAVLANDVVVGAQSEAVRDGQLVKFQVTESSEGYPQATKTRRVRRLIGEVLQLPGDPDGTDPLTALMGKEVRIRQADCGQLRLHVGDEVIFYCVLVGDHPPMLEGKVAELRSTSRSSSTLMGCISMKIPRVVEPAYIRAHALPDRIVLAGVPEDMTDNEIRNVFSEFRGKDVIVTHDEVDCEVSGFASVSFPGAADVGRVLLRSYVAIAVGNEAKVVRISESNALMVRWSQVSLAAGYLVELRPVSGGVPGAWSSVDVAAGSLEKGSKLPPGLLGPQCSACRVNKLREVPYEARISYFTLAAIPRPLAAPESKPPINPADGPSWRAPSGNLIPSPAAPELQHIEDGRLLGVFIALASPSIPAENIEILCFSFPTARVFSREDGGGRALKIQWPTVVHATAYVVELWEENSQMPERFHRTVPENLREVLVELRVGNLQPAGSYSACVRAVAPCGCESQPSPWTAAPVWYPSCGYLPPAGWGQPPPGPLLHNGAAHASPLPSALGAGPSPLLSTNPLTAPTIPPVELPDDREALQDRAVEAAALVFGPEDATSTIEAAVNAAYALNGGQPDHGQFSSHRFVFMFKPGSYNVEVPVGYYTQVLGLGTLPTEVIFTSSKGVYSQESNFAVNPGALNTNENQGMLWAASQAAALRRLVVSNDLDLYQFRKGDEVAGFSSGGFLGNSVIRGKVSSGSQQQLRKVLQTPFYHNREEKPFISIEPTGKYNLNIPRVQQNYRGWNYDAVDTVGFEQVYVADASKDTAQSINAKLATGLHVVLSPGIYDLTEPIRVSSNQVLLGLGLATLRAKSAQSAVQVEGCGARLAGLLVAAGTAVASPLVHWEKSTGAKLLIDEDWILILAVHLSSLR
eukprot:g2373.t1